MDELGQIFISDAPFHDDIDLRAARCYLGIDKYLIDAGFRGSAKTARKKLFRAFVIANDSMHARKYFKIESQDLANAKQIVTDIFNIFVDPMVKYFYPEIFRKTEEKRSETMVEFDTATGVKVRAMQVGVAQRGSLQENIRPDDIWFDDFETKEVLRSAIKIKTIWDNMEEARDGLSLLGSATYTCNYLSERGNVHKLVQKYPAAVVLTPIKGRIEHGVHIDGPPTWPSKYSPALVEEILASAEDPAGEYLCVPASGEGIFFERDALNKQVIKKVIKDIAGFKLYHEYDPSHRYGGGADVAGGVKLDSSASVFIDFTQLPARVVATFHSNTIKPDVFGEELEHQCRVFGRPIIAPENNKFDACIGRLKQIYDNVFFEPEDETRAGIAPRVKYYGWNTNSMTKGTMLSALKKAVSDGHLELSDPDLIQECKSYTRDDLMDKDSDPRMVTHHFDLLIACAIAYQMKHHAEAMTVEDAYEQRPYEPSSEYETYEHRQTTQNNIHPV